MHPQAQNFIKLNYQKASLYTILKIFIFSESFVEYAVKDIFYCIKCKWEFGLTAYNSSVTERIFMELTLTVGQWLWESYRI